MIKLAVKVDVDTDRGTRVGVPQLAELFARLGIQATFLFSLGPDHTGRALKRVFRRGFVGKVVRTNVIKLYGLRTLMNGVFLPGPKIGQRNEAVLRDIRERGHEVGIHCHDHVKWQDGLQHMSRDEVFSELAKAQAEFQRIFGNPALTAGAAGWQANAFSLEAYDAAEFLYGSDTRGSVPFFPRVGDTTFRTLQIPTTLPTLDELMGRPEYPDAALIPYYLSQLDPSAFNVLTIHAEIEGMLRLGLMEELLRRIQQIGVDFYRLDDIARMCLAKRASVPVCEMRDGTVDGRSGTLAVQADVAVASVVSQ